MYYKYYSMMQVYNINVFTPPTPNPSWVTGLATIFMAYGCHPVFFYLRSELISKTDRRVKKVIGTAIGTVPTSVGGVASEALVGFQCCSQLGCCGVACSGTNTIAAGLGGCARP